MWHVVETIRDQYSNNSQRIFSLNHLSLAFNWKLQQQKNIWYLLWCVGGAIVPDEENGIQIEASRQKNSIFVSTFVHRLILSSNGDGCHTSQTTSQNGIFLSDSLLVDTVTSNCPTRAWMICERGKTSRAKKKNKHMRRIMIRLFPETGHVMGTIDFTFGTF